MPHSFKEQPSPSQFVFPINFTNVISGFTKKNNSNSILKRKHDLKSSCIYSRQHAKDHWKVAWGYKIIIFNLGPKRTNP